MVRMQYQEAGTLGNLVHPSTEAQDLLMMDNGVLHLNGDSPQ